MSRARVVALSLALTLTGCATPSLTNHTPATTARSPVPLYPLWAQVDPRGNRIAHVEAVIRDTRWPMSLLPTGLHAAGYFADPCETNIPYHFNVGYQRRHLLGSGYSSEVRVKRFPEAAGYLMTVTGEPVPGDCAASQGMTLRVDSTADSPDATPGDGRCQAVAGRCTLRAAVMESNARQGHDLIEVPAGRYVLTLTGSEASDVANDAVGDLDITDGVTLVGLGYSVRNEDLAVVIDGNRIDRIFDIHAAAPAFVTLSALRLENGQAMNHGGGAIWNRGNLRMDRMLLRGNRIATDVGLTCGASAGMRLCNRGGALFNEGQALIARTTVEGNSTGFVTGFGGGISNLGERAQLYLRGSLVTGNDARFGGGVTNFQGLVDIQNSTFVDNRSTTSGVRAAELANVNGTVEVRNATFSNISQIFSHSGPGRFRLANSLVETRSFNALPFCTGALSSAGFNVIGGSNDLVDRFSGCGYSASTTDKTTIRLALDSLRDNGGATRTIGLRPPHADSPFFSPIDVGGVLCPEVDQRGRSRSDGNCDSGAFEF